MADTFALIVALKALKGSIKKVFSYKGAVNTYGDLPSGASDGNTYLVLNEDHGYPEGTYSYSETQGTWSFNKMAPVNSVNGKRGDAVLGASDILTNNSESVETALINIDNTIAQLESLVNDKLDKQQDAHYAGKYLVVGDDGIITFAEGGSGGTSKKNAYNSISKITDYAYCLPYSELDYLKAKAHYELLKPSPQDVKVDRFSVNRVFHRPFGACSAFRVGNKGFRNYDWYYSNLASLVTTTPARNGLYEVTGISMQNGINAADCDSELYNELFDIAPHALVDGVNDKGLFCCVLVVPNDKGDTIGTIPQDTLKDEICSLQVVRYILEHYVSVQQAYNELRDHVSIYNPTTLTQMGYELHFFLVDSHSNSGVIEFVNNTIVYHACDFVTNFYIDGVIFNDDGSVYTPATQDENHDALITNLITEYGSGLERYNLINKALPSIQSEQDAIALLYNLRYSLSYQKRTNPFRYTEFVGGAYKVNTPVEEYDAPGAIVDLAIGAWERKDRNDPTVWHTMHGCMYDTDTGELYVVFQEDMNTIHHFRQEYFTKDKAEEVFYKVYTPVITLNVDISEEEPVIEDLTPEQLAILTEKQGRVKLNISIPEASLDFNFVGKITEDDKSSIINKLPIVPNEEFTVYCYTSSLAIDGKLNFIVLVYSTGQVFMNVDDGGSGFLSYEDSQDLDEYQFNTVHNNLQDGASRNTRRIAEPFLSKENLNVEFINNQYSVQLDQAIMIGKANFEIYLDFGKYTINVEGQGNPESNCIDVYRDSDIGYIDNIVFDNTNNIMNVNISNPHLENMPILATFNISTWVEETIRTPFYKHLIPYMEILNFTDFEVLLTEAKTIFGAINELFVAKESTLNKKNAVTDSSSDYVSSKAVYDYFASTVDGYARVVTNADTITVSGIYDLHNDSPLGQWGTLIHIGRDNARAFQIAIGVNISTDNSLIIKGRAKINTTVWGNWFEIPSNLNTLQSDLTSLPSFDNSKTQVLKNINGTLTWVDEPQKEAVDYSFEDSSAVKYLFEKAPEESE